MVVMAVQVVEQHLAQALEQAEQLLQVKVLQEVIQLVLLEVKLVAVVLAQLVAVALVILQEAMVEQVQHHLYLDHL
jgi:hypothetical protein